MPDEDESTGKQQVADPEEFNQQRRLRSIHDARDRARTVYELTQDPEYQQEAGYKALAANYRAAVENYVGELRGLLARYNYDEDETDYWQGYELGEVTLPVPEELHQLQADEAVSVIDASGLEPETNEIVGLRDYLMAQPPFEETYAMLIYTRKGGEERVARTVSMEMPIDISRAAQQAADMFMTLTGFDVEIEEGEHRAKVSDEAVEKVDTWRQNNNLDA